MNTQVNDPKGAAGALKAPTMAEMAEALRKAVLWGECASRHILYRENINWRFLDEARATLAAHSLHTVKEKPLSPSDATPCSPIVGYRLENGTDKAELYFLPNRLAQKTLDQMADLISDGWMVTGIIYSENESSGGTAGAGL